MNSPVDKWMNLFLLFSLFLILLRLFYPNISPSLEAASLKKNFGIERVGPIYIRKFPLSRSFSRVA